jgi:chromate transporter
VVQQGWLTHQQFSSSVALAQAAPGPNVLFVALMGWNVGINAGGAHWGALGAALCLLGIVIPSSLLTLFATRWAQRNRSRPGVRAFKSGLTPLVVALLASTSWLLLQANVTPERFVLPGLLVVAATVILWRTSIHLLWVLAAGAVLGGMGWV